LHLLCVGGIVYLPWFSKKLKTTYRRTTGFVASPLYFSFANQYSLSGAFPFPIVVVPRYKLSLCHTPIKPDLLGFPGINVVACGLRHHVITRFTSTALFVVQECMKQAREINSWWSFILILKLHALIWWIDILDHL